MKFFYLPILMATAVMSLPGLCAQEAAPAAPVRLGVVDIVKVLDRYAKRKDLAAELDRRNQSMRRLMEQAVDEAGAIEDKLEAKPRPDNYAELEKQRDESMRSNKKKVLLAQVELKKFERLFQDTVYDDVRQVVREISMEKDLDLVIRVVEGERPNVLDFGAVFTSDKVDITDETIRRLNAKYAKEKAAKDQ